MLTKATRTGGLSRGDGGAHSPWSPFQCLIEVRRFWTPTLGSLLSASLATVASNLDSRRLADSFSLAVRQFKQRLNEYPHASVEDVYNLEPFKVPEEFTRGKTQEKSLISSGASIREVTDYLEQNLPEGFPIIYDCEHSPSPSPDDEESSITPPPVECRNLHKHKRRRIRASDDEFDAKRNQSLAVGKSESDEDDQLCAGSSASDRSWEEMSCCADNTLFHEKSEEFKAENDSKFMSREIFVNLMHQFYHMGWMRGSGGAMGCVHGREYYLSPSALQKERLNGYFSEEIFVYDAATKELIQRPSNKDVKETSCSVLFDEIMGTANAHCVIHTHSKSANLITQLVDGNEFRISHQEYIKGIFNPSTQKNLGYEDTLVVPIVANMPREEQLLPAIKETLAQYPNTCAVLVRNHGVFVWGPDWEKAKIMAECYDYLFELSIDMLKLNIPLVKSSDTKDVKAPPVAES